MKKNAVFAWAVLLPMVLFCVTPASAELLDPSTLTKYIDPLPQPPIRQPVGRDNGRPLYEVHVKAAMQKMHSELDSTPVFTFDGATPGPSFVVPMGQPIRVRYYNDLPENHMFNVDTNIHVMMGQGWGQSSRFVAHLHGGDVEASSDGWCMDFVYPGGQFTYDYPNSQEGAALWYHDHSCGITRLNAYAGIAGFYIITDPRENKLNLPSGPNMLGIAVQDRSFNTDGSLFYPEEWVPEFFGDVSLVNGVVWPVQTVEPRKYRIRFLNGCNDRYLSMKLVESDGEGNIGLDSVAGPAIHMIGTEQGLVNNTIVLNDPGVTNSPRLLVAPGQRRDLIIDFAGLQGKHFVVTNNAPAPFTGSFDEPTDVALTELFMFSVKDTTVVDNAEIPQHPGNVEEPKPDQTCFTRDIFLHEIMDSTEMPMMVLLNDLHFMDPVTDFPTYNCKEIWRYINATGDAHPIHPHLINAQILDRQPFDVDTFLDPLKDHKIVFTGPAVPPAPQEEGRLDEVDALPGYVTRILTSKFNRLGKYVYHCHILAHEENDMMRPYVVVLPNDSNSGGHTAGVEPLVPALGISGPEPFRGRASIRYSAGIEQHVRLSVYNALGQEIRTLVDGPATRGIHTAVWDGTNNAGAQVAAGSYFYKLETPKGSQTLRATLLR